MFRLKANQRLQRIAGEFESEILDDPEIDIYDGRHHEFYRAFTYKAASWDEPRNVMLKLEKPVDQLLFIPTFIVTTLDDSPEDTVQFYAERGKMENYIKEGKLGFAFGQMSSTAFEINANKLQIAVLAYNLNNGTTPAFVCRQKMKKAIKSKPFAQV
ncbi:hypothetical protein Len3610_09130 [Lentibacillus sp. CBA3610]|nr:transposase [Lentibacillus sp. CBA3610]QKY69741.1 hypothetical protein Len3610_09130 [Lentibacillus sp. CBA3610]